jgi:anaerobic selenocysteine-containing dehydrogenase
MKEPDASFVPVDALFQGHAAHSDGESRRRFLEIMGAALAMAGAAGCTRQPTEFIMPYVEPPEKAVPGVPSYYATARLVNGIAQGVVVETHLGRPTKVEGNPGHPASLGATDVHGQACVLDLYDPDRTKQITEFGETRQWDGFILALRQMLGPLQGRGGDGLYILSETVTSPTLGAQRAALLAAMPNARWHQFDPAGGHSARAGAQLAFGRLVNTYYRLDRADVILALDSDFLATGPASTRYAHDYANRRRIRGSNVSMNRLYAVECEITSTGGKAEHRLALRPGELEGFAAQLAGIVSGGGAAQGSGANGAWISALARDLLAHRGASAVIAGEAQSPAVHALAHAMNAALGNVGTTVIHTDPIEVAAEDQIASLGALVSAMDAGKVKLLLMLGGNPVYNAPADFGFADKLKKIENAIHVTLHPNETSVRTRWVVPQRHFLED